MTLHKKEKVIEELEEKCLSFENRALSLEQENDSLRLALKIIVQEKNECDSRPQKTDDRWSLVENTDAVNHVKIRRNQTITSIPAIDLSPLGMRFSPPNSPQDIFQQFESLIDKVDSEQKDFYFLGDLNCNMQDGSNHNSSTLTNILNIYGLSQLISEPTRITRTSSTLIDLCITNSPEKKYQKLV